MQDFCHVDSIYWEADRCSDLNFKVLLKPFEVNSEVLWRMPNSQTPDSLSGFRAVVAGCPVALLEDLRFKEFSKTLLQSDTPLISIHIQFS